jgi:hypothetical protein
MAGLLHQYISAILVALSHLMRGGLVGLDVDWMLLLHQKQCQWVLDFPQLGGGWTAYMLWLLDCTPMTAHKSVGLVHWLLIKFYLKFPRCLLHSTRNALCCCGTRLPLFTSGQMHPNPPVVLAPADVMDQVFVLRAPSKRRAAENNESPVVHTTDPSTLQNGNTAEM